MKILVAVPTGDFIRMETVRTIVALKGNAVDVAIEHGPYIHLNRENLILQSKGYSHIFFVDTDVCFNADVLETLVSRDKDIIGGIYNLRRLPLSPIIRMANEKGEMIPGNIKDLPTEPFKCHALGTGCMLIKTEVFDKIKRPWFFYGKPDESHEGMGEDIWFCTKAQEAGFDIWADPIVKISHTGMFNF